MSKKKINALQVRDALPELAEIQELETGTDG